MEGLLTIPFQSPSIEDSSTLYDDDTIWINLEQEELDDDDNKVDAEDLVAMYNIVLRGESAFTYNSGSCPVSITPNEVIPTGTGSETSPLRSVRSETGGLKGNPVALSTSSTVAPSTG